MVEDEAPLGRKFVLVVEDEPLLLLMAGDIVGDAGFEAILVPNAKPPGSAGRARHRSRPTALNFGGNTLHWRRDRTSR